MEHAQSAINFEIMNRDLKAPAAQNSSESA